MFWTAQEDELIQGLHSGKYTKEEVARRLPHRTAEAVQKRKSALARVAGATKKMTNWSADEDKLIIELREGRLSIDDVVRQLPHRTKAAIEKRKSKKQSATSTTSDRAVRFWTPQEDALLAGGLPDDPAALAEFMRRLPGRTVVGIEHRLHQLKRAARVSGAIVTPTTKKRKHVYWTAQEDALIAGGIPDDPAALEALMRRLPDRTVRTVQTRLHLLNKAARTNINLTTTTMEGKRRMKARDQSWTTQEDELVVGITTGLYTTRDVLQRLPHRNKTSIEHRLASLRKAGVIAKDSVRSVSMR